MDEVDSNTLRWIGAATGRGIVATEPLAGGMSSVVHRCRLDDGTEVVIKHVRDAAWLQREPDLLAREVRALELLADHDLPVPRHVASDPPNGRLLVSALPGRMCVDPDPLGHGVAAIAEIAARIAAVPLPDAHGLPAWRSWAADELEPPTWGDTTLWQHGITAFCEHPRPAHTGVLLHRDLHPLNLLWDAGRIVGVVDWLNACVGHPHAELGHCRWNLAVAADVAAAERFVDHYTALSDAGRYSPWWDLSTVMGLLPGPIGAWGYHAVGRTDLTDEAVVARTETFLRAALDRL